MITKRRRNTAAFKLRVTLEAVEGSKTTSYPTTTVQGQWPCTLSCKNIK